MQIIFFLIAGFIAQLVDGTAGMGFGVTSSSILLGLGIAPIMASASIHTAEVFTTLASGISHWKLGNVKKEWLLSLALPGIVGAVLGCITLSLIATSVIKPWVAAILLIMGILMIYRFTKGKLTPRPISKKKLGIVGLVAAFFDAVGGGGWGPIATPAIVIATNEEPRKVVGTVNTSEFIITVTEAITFLLLIGFGNYNWLTIGVFAIAGILAAPLAAWLCKRLNPKILGITVGIVVILYNLRTILKVFGLPLP